MYVCVNFLSLWIYGYFVYHGKNHLLFQYLIYVMLVRPAGSQYIWVSHWDQYRWAGYQTRNFINYVVS